MNIGKTIIAGIGVVLAILLIGILGKWESSYKRNACVQSVNDGIVTFKDNSGNLWACESEEFQVGEDVILVLHDCGTANAEDDAIMEIQLVSEE